MKVCVQLASGYLGSTAFIVHLDDWGTVQVVEAG